jgi:hypothetical protein
VRAKRETATLEEPMGKKESEVFADLARKRWRKKTAKERSASSSELAKARWDGSTPEERSEAASKAAKARWAKKKAGKKKVE